MRTLLLISTLAFGSLALPGCGQICPSYIQSSPVINVVDAETGEPVPTAVVTFTVNGGAERMPAESDNGRFVLAVEEEGLFEVAIEADGYAPVSVEYDVGIDPKNDCHVESVLDTVELVPVAP